MTRGRPLFLSAVGRSILENQLLTRSESVPKGLEAALVGWVQPTEYQGFALVGCTHPTTVRRGFWDRLSVHARYGVPRTYPWPD